MMLEAIQDLEWAHREDQRERRRQEVQHKRELVEHRRKLQREIVKASKEVQVLEAEGKQSRKVVATLDKTQEKSIARVEKRRSKFEEACSKAKAAQSEKTLKCLNNKRDRDAASEKLE